MPAHGGGSSSGIRAAASRFFANGRLPSAEQRAYTAAVFNVLERFERPRRLWPLLLVNAAGFYTGIIVAAVREQLYKEAYWDEHPGEAVPLMRSVLYQGKQRMRREDLGDDSGE